MEGENPVMVAPRWRPCTDVKAGAGWCHRVRGRYEYETPSEKECGIYVIKFHTCFCSHQRFQNMNINVEIINVGIFDGKAPPHHPAQCAPHPTTSHPTLPHLTTSHLSPHPTPTLVSYV